MTQSVHLPIIDHQPVVADWQWPEHDRLADLHQFETMGRHYVLLANATQVFEISGKMAETLRGSTGESATDLLYEVGLNPVAHITDEPFVAAGIRSLSLAVAQKCNLGCAYCYAEGGSFGGAANRLSHICLILKRNLTSSAVQMFRPHHKAP